MVLLDILCWIAVDACIVGSFNHNCILFECKIWRSTTVDKVTVVDFVFCSFRLFGCYARISEHKCAHISQTDGFLKQTAAGSDVMAAEDNYAFRIFFFDAFCNLFVEIAVP